MAQKITLTPQQIALAQSDDIDPNLTTDMGDDGLEEVAEDTSTDNDPPEGNEDYYEQIRNNQDDGTGSADAGSDDKEWLTDDLKAFGQSYGLSEEDLEAFESADQLQRFGEMTDRRMAQDRSRQQSSPPPKKQEEEVKTTDDLEKTDEGLIDIEKMKEENYDENSIRMAKS